MQVHSKIVEQFACSRTKTTAIIKKALSPTFSDEVVQICRTSPFTLLCDGGNDQSHQKYFGITVRYWDKKFKQPVTRFLSTVDFTNKSLQLNDDELGIGTSTRLLLCGEFEDLVGTRIEQSFFTCVRIFYETCVSKMIDKFPFNNKIIQQLAFLDPRNKDKASFTGIVHLANQFASFSPDKMDTLGMEFRDYRASTLDQLPAFCENDECAVDHFWKDMASVTSVMNSEVYRFGKLSKFSHIILVISYSNADVERLFSMVRKIETEKRRSQLDQSTVCDLFLL